MHAAIPLSAHHLDIFPKYNGYMQQSLLIYNLLRALNCVQLIILEKMQKKLRV